MRQSAAYKACGVIGGVTSLCGAGAGGVGLGRGGWPLVRPSCSCTASAGVGLWRGGSGCGCGIRSGWPSRRRRLSTKAGGEGLCSCVCWLVVAAACLGCGLLLLGRLWVVGSWGHLGSRGRSLPRRGAWLPCLAAMAGARACLEAALCARSRRIPCGAVVLACSMRRIQPWAVYSQSSLSPSCPEGRVWHVGDD